MHKTGSYQEETRDFKSYCLREMNAVSEEKAGKTRQTKTRVKI